MTRAMGCVLAILLVIGLGLVTCASAQTPGPTAKQTKGSLPSSLSIGTASVGGAYYILGTALASLLEKKLGIPVPASPGEGSAENIRLLDRKEVDMGIVAMNTAYPAFRGMQKWKEMTFLRALVGIYEHPSPFITLAKTGVKDFADLKGKRIGAGSGKATWEPITKAIFECEGIPWDKVDAVYAGADDLASQLTDGLITAMNSFTFAAGTMPIPAVRALIETRKDVVFVKNDVEKIKHIADYGPWMNPTVIPVGAPGVTKENWPNGFPCVDIGGPAIMVRADMDEALAYLLTKNICENLGQLSEMTNYFEPAYKNPENLVKARGVPFHPGAIKYLKEAGLWKE